jgi:tetratricopeptide (TPR) repeat protein
MMELDVLRAELERLFELDELMVLSHDVLGFDPERVGGTSTLGSFAGALVGYCRDVDALEALSDAVVVTKPQVDRRATQLAAAEPVELKPGQHLGSYEIVRRVADGRLGTLYLARKDGQEVRLRLLKPAVAQDRRGLHRFLTITRLAGRVEHPSLPRLVEAGLVDGHYVTVHAWVESQQLATRIARTGPMHVNEARPLLQSLASALAALHRQGLAHGDVSLDNIGLWRAASGEQSALLFEAGSDRLRLRVQKSRVGLSSTGASPKSVSPEQIQGADADARSDVYSFGAVMYELLTGRAPFPGDVLETAFGHLRELPEAPSKVAPRGWVTEAVDRFVLSLLAKEPDERPATGEALLEALESLARQGAAAGQVTPEELTALEQSLLAEPGDPELARELEAATERGAPTASVAEALARAAALVDDSPEQKRTLLLRAARLFERGKDTLGRAEQAYREILALDADDQVALAGLEEVCRRAGKYEELIEMLLGRAEQSQEPGDKARAMAEIGRIYARELDDAEQGVIAYSQAFCYAPTENSYAHEIERLAGANEAFWAEVLSALGESSQDESLPVETRTVLLLQAGDWYRTRLSRPDLALPCLQSVLAVDPGNERALVSLTELYRKAQQWVELGMVLTRRADAAATPALARDLRTQSAEILEKNIGDVPSARAIYEQVLSEDPGHVGASDALARLYERSGDFQALAQLLEQRSQAQRGAEQVRTLCKIAELYEDRLADQAEAVRRYEAALALDPTSLDALHGLERVFAKTGRYKELLQNLESQIALAATPKQRVALLERIAAVHEEEFLDHEAAAGALERALATDAVRVSVMANLVRYYRVLNRWEDACRLYERQLALVEEPKERIALAMAWGRLLAEQVGSPDRAAQAYELVLQLEPEHSAALEALARLRERSGDADAALEAILALADQATTPEARAEQLLRAAKLLEDRGDKDGAIDHYKQALDANPKDKGASAALRAAYVARGDVAAAVDLLELELGRTEGERAQARLAGEMARLLRDKVKDDLRAEQAAKRAVQLDPSNMDALRVLGDIAFEDARFVEASAHYGRMVGRVESLGQDEAVRILVRYVDASSNAGSTEKALAAMDTLLRLAPENAEALARVAQVTFEHGAPERAAELLGDYLERFGGRLRDPERALATYRYGEALRRAGLLDQAIPKLEEACDLDPSLAAPLVALANAHAQTENWLAVVHAKSRHLDIAGDDERAQLLIELGELAASKLGDRTQATKSYVAALELRPDDRKLLTKLMQLYSEDKDWNKLVEVVLKLAEFVDEPAQKVKYLHTAAMVTARQVEDPAQAAVYFDQVLELDPKNLKALEEYISIERDAGNYKAVVGLLTRRVQLAQELGQQPLALASYDELASVYETKLVDYPAAIEALEAATDLDPENRERAEKLASLYESDPEAYQARAVALQEKLLAQNPFRQESYKALRKIYTATRNADASWCLCQTLTLLKLAEPDEERFFARMRAETAAPAQEAFSEEDWVERVMHPSAHPLLTAVFALIEGAVVQARAQSLAHFGFTEEHRIDPATHPAPLAQTLYYAAGVLGISLPAVYENAADPGGLSFLPTAQPSIVLGRVAMSHEVPPQVAAFVAARQLAYYRPGMYLRHFITTGTGLKSWLFAAIKLTAPQFPVAPDLEGPVTEALAALKATLRPELKEHLNSVVSKVLQSGTPLDLKRWVAAVDLTADRAGFIAAHDLEAATQVVQASEEGAAAVANQERYKELVLYSASARYFDLRRRLGITIDS